MSRPGVSFGSTPVGLRTAEKGLQSALPGRSRRAREGPESHPMQPFFRTPSVQIRLDFVGVESVHGLGPSTAHLNPGRA
jgi:hypothetical protein